MRFIYTKAFLTVIAILVALVVVLGAQSKGYLDPALGLIRQIPRPFVAIGKSIVRPIRDGVKSLFSLRTIAKENGELKARVTELQNKTITFDQLAFENETLKKELKFRNVSKYTLIPCTVKAIDPQGLSDAFVMDCGSSDGVVRGAAVLSSGYVLGKVELVSDSSSTALLLTNTRTAIDVEISRNSELGLVSGSYGSGLILDHIPQTASLERGDIIITAGVNNAIPKGLLVGEVRQILSVKNDLFQKAAVSTPLLFHDVKFVYVVKP